MLLTHFIRDAGPRKPHESQRTAHSAGGAESAGIRCFDLAQGQMDGSWVVLLVQE
jgi:hypothetical protein